jgi:hypothetical protein
VSPVTELAAQVLKNERDRYRGYFPGTKLTKEQAQEIRNSKLPIKQIAADYGIALAYAYTGKKRIT